MKKHEKYEIRNLIAIIIAFVLVIACAVFEFVVIPPLPHKILLAVTGVYMLFWIVFWELEKYFHRF